MSEQTFRSPNFYEREIDLSAAQAATPVGTPAGVIGTSNKGPAFVPVTVANFSEWTDIFGDLDPKKFGPYAVNEFLKHRSALTYLRVLGAGANSTETNINTTIATGRVTNAGVKFEGTAAAHDSRGRHVGAVQFIAARHTLQTNEAYGMPMFTDNSSFNGSVVNLVRGMVILASGARLMVLDGDESAIGAFTAAGPDDFATLASNKFKLVISSTLGNEFNNIDNTPGVKIFTASLDPSSADYFGKILNRDPDKFVTEQHLLYADFPVDAELAAASSVAVLSGSTRTSSTSGETTTEFRKAFGAFDTRFTAPASPWFISQPFGVTEYDLFKFEAIDDGEYANNLYKISITNLKASLDESNLYGTFTVQIRDWNDTDTNQNVLESFPNCTLDPTSENYVAKVIGDRKVTFNFDAVDPEERRIVTFGKYPNVSKLVRIVMAPAVEKQLVPAKTLPFGFRGPELLKTNDSLNDTAGSTPRLVGVLGSGVGSSLSGSILPPLPMRFKITKGDVSNTGLWAGQPGATEVVNSQFSWGVKFERNDDPLNANLTSEKNLLLNAYTKFLGIRKLDVLTTGSGADTINLNKFTLAKVALSNSAITEITASVKDHMKEAAYVRNGVIDPTQYTVNDGVLTTRVSLATILAKDTAANFNKFSPFAKFTTFMMGGFDGLNFIDKNARRMNDKSTSFDSLGGAESSYVTPGLLSNPAGTGQSNSTVKSYVTAIDIMTDPMVVNTNILVIPGIKESFLTEYAAQKVKDYGLAYYVMDIPGYDENSTRLYDDSTTRPDVDKTVTTFDGRALDNSYGGSYFPDIFIDDVKNKRRVKVPASVAAMGAIAYNDRFAYPWFAPAGFNRASLDFVTNVAVRLNVTDRDRLYDSRINPIATFPKLGYVIFGQKTLQLEKSALDRVNVRRLMLEIKRQILEIARKIVFEQPTNAIRDQFVSDAKLKIGLIKTQSGVEKFDVIMDDTNNSQEDRDLGRLRGKIIVIPTKSIEFLSIDFIITNSGVEFL